MLRKFGRGVKIGIRLSVVVGSEELRAKDEERNLEVRNQKRETGGYWEVKNE